MKKQLLSLALLSAAWLAGGSAQAHDGDHSYTNGICTIAGCTDKYQAPALVDGWYELTNAGNVEWISEFVAGSHGGTIYPKVKMMNDIDFTGVSHSPIGPSSAKKFNGIFDGQGHRITNMVVNLPDQENVGLIGWARGPQSDVGNNTQIQNLIIDKTCSFTGKGRVAAFIGRGEVSNNTNSIVYITNCVNEASVTATTGTCAAFVGTHNADDNSPRIWISGCANHGNITAGSSDYAAAFIGWYKNNGRDGGNSTIENSYNTGVVSPKDGGTILFRGSYRTITNTYDLTNAENTQGSPFRGINDWSTADPVASGELAYYINQQAGKQVFYQTFGTDAYPVPFNTSGIVYNVADYYCDGTPKGSLSYSNTDGGSHDDHNYDSATGLCTRCSYPKEDWMSASADGFYHLSTPAQVEWFSHMVRDAYHGAMKVKLDADIDYEGVANAHLPIGSSAHKYFGHFDGQGHRIKGMVLTTASGLENRGYDGQGFFGSVRGGGTDANSTVTNEVIIENLIIDASCSIQHDNNFAAGVVAHINSTNSGAFITIQNCGNEANVSSTGKNIAGILGCVEATNVGLKLYNLWNKGNISGSTESAAICAWTGQRNVDGEVDVEGCWNIGEVTGVDGNGYNLIRRNSNIVPRNIVDLCTTNAGNQGKVSVLNTADPITSGELCYLLNGDQSTIVYTQNLGTDEMPVYGTTSLQVYQAGTVNCLGAAVGGVTYNNTSGETIVLGHNINDEIGMCDVCYTQFQAPALVDGYYEIKNAGNLEWFSHKVDEGGDANLQINGKLMNDIDMLGIENLHLPIGVNTGKKYNGTFDGQGFRIKNMIIERPTDSNIGFFGFLRGNAVNTTVKNLIMDKSCTIHGYNRVGGITGSCQNNGALIILENIINEATVIAEKQDAAGIIGGQEGNGPKWLIKNVLNLGTVTAKNEAPYAGALCCYLGGNGESVIENFVNLGTINGHRGGNIGRIAGTHTNIIDLSDTDPEGTNPAGDNSSGNIGFDTGLTKADIANGKLAWYINSKDNQAADAFFQRLGTGGEAYPSPFGAAGVLYLGETGYTTMYDTKNNWSLSADAHAYIGKVSGSYLSLVGIDDVPAGTAVVIKGTPNTYSNKEFVATATADVTDNALKGSDGSDTDKGNGSTIFALANGANGVGFYPVGNDVPIPAGKAYLVDNTGSVKGFTFVFDDDATGIEDFKDLKDSKVIYNVAGQRISKMQKGINIVNGKKVMVK